MMNAQGQLLDTVRTATTPAVFTASMGSRWVAERVAAVTPERRPDYRRQMEDVPLPDSLSAYGSFVTAADRETLWVEDGYRVGERPGWTAYRAGRATRRLFVPDDFVPLDFGTDAVLGLGHSELGTQRIELRAMRPAISSDSTDAYQPPRRSQSRINCSVVR
jgi:hypothetical protein